MGNIEKAYEFLGRIFNGADARLPDFAKELAGMLDQAEEEGKVRYQTELEADEENEAAADERERQAERSPQAADEDRSDEKREEPAKQAPERRTTGRVVAGGKPHPKKKR